MKQITAPAIILRRTNYGEADRIVTFLTPAGKIKAMVKGVRRSKSKLAGGIELFSESTITFMETRGELARVISTRLNAHWSGVIGDLQRMMFGYEVMKLFDQTIENDASDDHYELLKDTLIALDDTNITTSAVAVWFYARFLRLLGHEPNLKTDHSGNKLDSDVLYTFSPEDMCFSPSVSGVFRAEHIKLLRLCLSHKPAVLKQVKDITTTSEPLQNLLKQLVQRYSQ